MNSTNDVNPGTNVVIFFSEPVNGVTVTNTSFTLKRNDDSNIVGKVTVATDRLSATFDPTDSLPEDTNINVNVNMSVTDDSGNNLDQPFTSFFITGTAPEVTGPTVTEITIRVEQKGPNYQAIAEVYADQDTLIEGTFYFTINGEETENLINSDSGTVVVEFVRLQSKKVRAPSAFRIEITNTPSGVLRECRVLLTEGTHTCKW